MKPPVPLEETEQLAFTKWLNAISKRYPDLWWSAVGHGGYKLSLNMQAKMRRLGIRRGTPDIIGCYRGRFWAVEMKRINAAPSDTSDDQLAIHRAITLAGGLVFVAKGAQAAITFVETNVLGVKRVA